MAKRSAQRSLFESADDEPSAEAVSLGAAVSGGVEPEKGTAAAEPDSLEGKTVYVVDAHSLIHQVFHAVGEMTSPQGQPVNAVYGFTRDLLYLLEEKEPDYLFCAFDLEGKTFRHEIYSDYKANRAEMPQDLAPQIPAIRRVVDALGLASLFCPSYEADDILATVARRTESLGGQCFLVTGDKDSRQLISDRVKIFNIRKNLVYDESDLMEEWGIRPDQVVDFQALVGDPTDNVPGVPLIGPKLARQLLQRYGTLDEVLAHADEVSGEKRKENLKAGREQALVSRQLVRLDPDVPIEIDWEAGRVGRIDRQAAVELFAEFGFRGFAERIGARDGAGIAPARRPAAADYRLVDSPEALAALVAELKKQKAICVDLETRNMDLESREVWPRWSEIVGYAIAWRPDQGWYIPVRAPQGEPCLDPQATLDALRPVLEDAKIEKIGQNIKYDMIVLRNVGVELAGVAFDTMVASYLLDAGQRNHNLDKLAQTYLKHETIKIAELIGTGKQQKRMDEVPVRQVADYAGEDAVLPVRLRPILARRLAEADLEELFEKVELPLVDVLVELEYNGIKVDVARLEELSQEFGRRMEAARAEIYRLAGHRFNVASPKQLQKVLFEELGLPVVKKTAKSGPSTDAGVLEELAARRDLEHHQLPARILEYRQYAKLKGTYVDALPKMVHPQTGRVHASFNQDVAATGRLSSSNPNLQNIPVRTELGRAIRSAFVPGEPEWLLVAADYSQIELRVLAHYSADERLCAAFARDEDIHARVASQVNGVPLEEVTPEMRRQAKAVNFGVIYGQSPFGLAKQLGIEQAAAAEFIDSYFEGYPGIVEFLARTLAECHKNGYVKTILGRRRRIEGVRPEFNPQRNLAERTAVNTVIQGSAADLIKQAMIAVHARLRREGLPGRMLLQIHDELIFETPPDQVQYVARLAAEEMSAVGSLEVPLKVDVSAGPNWADAEPLSVTP